MTKYIAYVTATKGTVLIGGTKHHESTEFDTEAEAKAWIATVLEVNTEARRFPSAWGWKVKS